MTPDLESQIKVSRMLGQGFAFSLVPMGGLGSLAALILGFKAYRLIRRSGSSLVGERMAWWCIFVGAFGAVLSPLSIAFALLRLSR